MRPSGAGTPLGAAISRRARSAMASPSSTPTQEEPKLDPGLLTSLRHHLLAGETHYPERPGMSELRERIGARLPGIGYPPREASGVLVTASEGESLLVTLLGLGIVPGGLLIARPGSRHQPLLDWLDLDSGSEGETGTSAGVALYREVHSLRGPSSDSALAQEGDKPHREPPPESNRTRIIDATGGLLFGEDSSVAPSPDAGPPEAPGARTDTIVIGNLSGLRGLDAFHLGFVAGDPEVLQHITKWKQACSICSPAPSQRAVLWALGVRP